MQALFDEVKAQLPGGEDGDDDFQDAVSSIEDEGSVPRQQLEYMELRLKTIAPRAALRKINLQYLEHRVS